MLSRRAMQGFTLIEAAVALGLMLAGIAGATALLLQCVRHERESATHRAVVRLAGSLAEELRAVRPPDGVPLAADAPTIAAWRTAAVAALPDGADARVELAEASPAAYRITIEWPVTGAGMQRLTLAVTT